MATLLAVAVAVAVLGSHRIETLPRPATRRSVGAVSTSEFKIAPSSPPRKQPSKVEPEPIISKPPQLIAPPWYRDRILLFVIGSALFVLSLVVLYYFLHG
jgi:hypothetical protein